jgi:hypothetical protein
VNVPLRTWAERASAESASRHAARLMGLDRLVPPRALRTAALEIADPVNGSRARREFLDAPLG